MNWTITVLDILYGISIGMATISVAFIGTLIIYSMFCLLMAFLDAYKATKPIPDPDAIIVIPASMTAYDADQLYKKRRRHVLISGNIVFLRIV